MRRTTMVMICAFVVTFSFGSALAQKAPQPLADILKVDYFDNANTNGAPDAKLRLSNPGTTGGAVCANIYVFDANQELSACCSCYLSLNGLRTLSVDNDLNADPLTGIPPTSGTVMVVSNVTAGSNCAFPIQMTPVSGGVRAWATHIESNGADGFSVTGSASQDATMSKGEENILDAQCHAIILGTNGGVCTCGTGS
jgi:hypothetical protein